MDANDEWIWKHIPYEFLDEYRMENRCLDDEFGIVHDWFVCLFGGVGAKATD